MQKPALISTREQRLFYWLRNGALPTDTVRSLLRRNGTWMKWSLTKKGLDESAIAKETEKWGMMQEAKHQREQEKKSRRHARKKKSGKPAESEKPQEQAEAGETPSA
jgi:small subunit ribosomal protein S16